MAPRAWTQAPGSRRATDGAVQGASGLYIADGSLLPSSIVNPMMTIIAMAHVACGNGGPAELTDPTTYARRRRRVTFFLSRG
jgi:hypothetical protein